jgi:uncharacterized protein
MSLPYRLEGGRMILHVRLTPKGGRDSLDGVETGADGKTCLKARVSAVPEDGKANAALVALLAKTFKVPKSAIRLVSGDTARMKQLEVSGGGNQLAVAETLSGLLGQKLN